MLPTPLTSFIGREREIREVAAALQNARLVTLLGAGGSGKTRLSLAVTSAVLTQFTDGWFVELAALSDGALVAQTVANAVGVREAENRIATDALIQHLGASRVLLVLDNCEQVIDACARLAHALLLACPQLVILATSREPLKVDGEQTYLVPLLSMPRGNERVPLSELGQYEAIRLFVERARAVNSQFALTEHNAAAITRLCRRLDGIPLAIELAAARTKILSPEQIAERLQDHFLLLKADSRTLLPRHQTLRAAMDWGYELLDAEERALLGRLSVFAGGFDFEAVEAIAPDLPILETMTCLVEKSLVVVEPHAQKTARYRLLETVRQYAHEKLQAAGGEDAVRDAHAAYFVKRIRQADGEFYGPRQIELLDWMDAENDNARSALEWLLHRARAGDTAAALAGLQAAASLWWYWDLRGFVREGRARIEPFISLAEQLPPSAEIAYAYIMFGHVAMLQGDRETAFALPHRALEMGQAIGDDRTIMIATQRIALHQARMPDPISALPTIEKALALGRRFRHLHVMYTMLLDIAEIAHLQGDEERAQACFQEALALIEQAGDRWNLAAIQYSIGVHELNHGNNAAALEAFSESLLVKVGMNDRRGLAYAFDSLAWMAARLDDPARAARLFGATDALFERMGARLFPRRQHLHNEAMAAAWLALGDIVYEAEYARGYALSVDEAVAQALGVSVKKEPKPETPIVPPPPAAVLVEPLSEREMQVLRLLSTNLSNREIADELIVSINTVKTQIASIYAKLDAHAREDAVLKARALGLL